MRMLPVYTFILEPIDRMDRTEIEVSPGKCTYGSSSLQQREREREREGENTL